MRAINADALKEYIENCDFCDNCKKRKLNCTIDCPFPDFLTDDWNRVIDEQPTVQRWIPCSERMPKAGTDVLVTRSFLGCKDYRHGWNAYIPPTTYVEVAAFICGKWLSYTDEYKAAPDKHTDPIAWMPLPAPYREGEE